MSLAIEMDYGVAKGWGGWKRLVGTRDVSVSHESLGGCDDHHESRVARLASLQV